MPPPHRCFVRKLHASFVDPHRAPPHPQLNRFIRKRQQAETKKKRRDLARTVAPFVEAMVAGA